MSSLSAQIGLSKPAVTWPETSHKVLRHQRRPFHTHPQRGQSLGVDNKRDEELSASQVVKYIQETATINGWGKVFDSDLSGGFVLLPEATRQKYRQTVAAGITPLPAQPTPDDIKEERAQMHYHHIAMQALKSDVEQQGKKNEEAALVLNLVAKPCILQSAYTKTMENWTTTLNGQSSKQLDDLVTDILKSGSDIDRLHAELMDTKKQLKVAHDNTGVLEALNMVEEIQKVEQELLFKTQNGQRVLINESHPASTRHALVSALLDHIAADRDIDRLRQMVETHLSTGASLAAVGADIREHLASVRPAPAERKSQPQPQQQRVMAHVAQVSQQPIGGSSNGELFYAAEDERSNDFWQPEQVMEEDVHVSAHVQSFTGKRKTPESQGSQGQQLAAAGYHHPGQSVQFQQQHNVFRPPPPVLAHQPPLEQQQVCQFFARGQCHHGANCRNLHLQPQHGANEQPVNVQMSPDQFQQYQMQQSQQQYQRQQALQMKAQGTSGAMHPTGQYNSNGALQRR